MSVAIEIPESPSLSAWEEKSKRLQAVIDSLATKLQIKEKVSAVVIGKYAPGAALYRASNIESGLKRIGAFAPDWLPRDGIILVASNRIPEDLWPGVVAHELGHMANGDLTRWSAVSRIPRIARKLLTNLPPLAIYLAASCWFKATTVGAFLTSWQALPSYLLLFSFVSALFALRDHHQEWKADECAAETVGAKEYLETLQWLRQHELYWLTSALSAPFVTHPSAAARIKRVTRLLRQRRLSLWV